MIQFIALEQLSVFLAHSLLLTYPFVVCCQFKYV